LRNDDGVWQRDAAHPHAHELSGQETAIRIRKHCTCLNSACLRIHPLGCIIQLAWQRVPVPAAELEIDRQVFPGDRLRPPGIHFTKCLPFFIRERETYIRRV
jgi:hypothetical protein